MNSNTFKTKVLLYVSYLALLGVSISAYFYYDHLSSESSLSPIVHLRKNYWYGGVLDRLYMQRSQKLSKERLNLNAWGGFHELKLDKILKLKEMNISFDISLAQNSYIYVYYDRSNEERMYGVRLSRNKMFPSMYFVRDGDGKFL